MRRLAVLTLAAIAAVSLAGESVAGSVVDYTFSFTSGTGVTPTVQAAGTLELTLNSGSTDQYTVTGATNVTISGTAIGGTDTLSLVPNTNAPNPMTDSTSGITFDNQIVLANGSKLLNDNGLLFSGQNSLYVNFYTPTGNSADFALVDLSGTNTNSSGVFALSVPEPSSFILAATALVPAIATAARRRRRARAAH